MNWYLHIQQNDEDGPIVRLAGNIVFLVGRGRDCDLRIRAPRVSRHHCQLVMREGKWHVEDLDSRNGTSVNGRPVECQELREGDEIQIGGVYLTLLGSSGNIPGSLDSTCDWPAQRAAQECEEPAAVELPQAQLLGRRYALGEQFHQGATGSFYKARDAHSDLTVCIKLFAKHVLADAADLERFVRGARTAGKLHHPNIVRLYHAGRSRNDRWWLAMEYVDGPSARQLAHEVGVGNMLSPERVISIARDITAALQVAFESQVVHRNIKPDNILLTKQGVAKLSEFTLTRNVVLTTHQQITLSHETVGDLAYLAPEWTEPGGVGDCRSDIYSLGASLYALLTGRPPFHARGRVELIDKVRNEDPVPPSQVHLSVPAALEGLVLKCLAKHPTDRFASPGQLAQELERVARYRNI